MPSLARKIPQYLTAGEIGRMMAVCTNTRDYLLVLLLWRTGGRITEVLGARVGDISDFGVRLRNLKGRTEADKMVLLNSDLVRDLRARYAGQAAATPLVTKLADTTPITRQRACQIIAAIGIRAGIAKRRPKSGTFGPPSPHWFRHGYAIHLLLNNIPITVIRDQLGHRNLANTEIYTQLADPARRDLLAAVPF